MESMASISVSAQHSTGSIIMQANENVNQSTSEEWTAQLQYRII
jgi:hypothetical protein